VWPPFLLEIRYASHTAAQSRWLRSTMAESKKRDGKRAALQPSHPPKASAAKPKHRKEESPTKPESKLEGSPILFQAIESFVRENTIIESSIPIEAAIGELAQCVDMMSVFTVPLQRGLFGMDSALRWLLFLTVAPVKAVSESYDDPPFSSETPLSVQTALTLLTQVYDLGVQEAALDHFEEDESEDDADSAEEAEPHEDD
jgi:hypothetical protein